MLVAVVADIDLPHLVELDLVDLVVEEVVMETELPLHQELRIVEAVVEDLEMAEVVDPAVMVSSSFVT
jgi:hypothetical protein